MLKKLKPFKEKEAIYILALVKKVEMANML